uniref:Uncharacterized protein n=1 Tax=Avena sativa TaxID=4498 RepID=A0ACD5YJN0_AVESA
MQHIEQFYKLWERLANINLDQHTPDDITWKLTRDGCYSAKSAYNMQYLGQVNSLMLNMVWKPWATPKCKTFAWLVLQNRVWTVDRLTRRGWPNCDRCKLCSQTQESASHLLFKCRYSMRVWNKLKDWLGLQDINTANWHHYRSVKEWWKEVIHKRGAQRKAMSSMAMLVSWEIWKERNARVSRNHSITVEMLVNKIKEEVSM